MDETELRLDGNALAGVLQEVFAVDMTSASGTCAHCGMVAELGSLHLYRYPRAPGAVLRCTACGSVVLVIVERHGGYRLNFQGLGWLEISGVEPEAATG